MSATVAAAVEIPASHADLLTRPVCGVLTTLGPDGAPESSLVWADYDGLVACVNTTLERRKGRNLMADPRVTLLLVDPANTGRYLQIRGDAELGGIRRCCPLVGCQRGRERRVVAGQHRDLAFGREVAQIM